jgi:hypothetical protein
VAEPFLDLGNIGLELRPGFDPNTRQLLELTDDFGFVA